MSNLTKIVIWGICLLNLVGCSDDFQANNTVRSLSGSQIDLKLEGLEAMSGQHYEGWIVTDSGVNSTGRFNINNNNPTILLNNTNNKQL